MSSDFPTLDTDIFVFICPMNQNLITQAQFGFTSTTKSKQEQQQNSMQLNSHITFNSALFKKITLFADCLIFLIINMNAENEGVEIMEADTSRKEREAPQGKRPTTYRDKTPSQIFRKALSRELFLRV